MKKALREKAFGLSFNWEKGTVHKDSVFLYDCSQV